eukprot:TRINITY_DN5361_c0_g1_i2.p1 TRINITY_DN5361_c0_g1~~TRINITY_DN5361_c0_g1_i2.p1  ORF type:complete len:122 (+),score=35.56 TRINITY_DN5361_c0_g1_i2:62-427(+)
MCIRDRSEFIEVSLNSDGTISAIFIGVDANVNRDQYQAKQIDVYAKEPEESMEATFKQSQEEFMNEGQGKQQKKPEEEKSFFNKYFWYILIAGFLLFNFVAGDKEALQGAAGQAQQSAQRR